MTDLEKLPSRFRLVKAAAARLSGEADRALRDAERSGDVQDLFFAVSELRSHLEALTFEIEAITETERALYRR